MAIPTYDFYTNQYYGASIPQDDWDRIANHANDELVYFERIYTVTDPTTDGSGCEKAVCAIADQMYTYEAIASSEIAVDNNGNPTATSVSIGSVSTSVKTPNTANMGVDMSDAGRKRSYYDAARRYVSIYRGAKLCQS